MAGGRVVVASEIASDFRHQDDRLTEHRLDNYVIRLGEDSGAELMVTAAHLHRGGRFIKDRPINIHNGTLPRNGDKSTV